MAESLRQKIIQNINASKRWSKEQKELFVRMANAWAEDSLDILLQAFPAAQEATDSRRAFDKFSSALAKDVEEFSKTMRQQSPKELTAHIEDSISKKEEARQKTTGYHDTSGYKLADVLERAKIRAEAGLQIEPDQAKLIIQLINQQKKEVHGR